MTRRIDLALGLALAVAGFAAAPAFAYDADCTFRGGYGEATERFTCDFEKLDRQGSFNVTGNGYFIQMDIRRKNRGNGNMSVGGPTFDLGPFVRERGDRACWLNQNSGARICAY